MTKKISVALSVLAACLLVFILLFTSMEFVMNDTAFVSREYNKLMLSREIGVNSAELVDSYKCLVDYMQGEREAVDIIVTLNGEKVHMFADEQEISHMKDVRTLYQRVEGLRDTAVIAMLVLLTVSAVLALKTAAHSIAKGFMIGVFVSLMPLGFIATWAALDFSNFWNFFHESLFWNEDWLFPAESRMIRMLPEQFFMDMVLRIVTFAGLALIILLAIAWLVIAATHRREEKDYEKALEAAKKKRRLRKKREAALAKKAATGERSPAKTERSEKEHRKKKKKQPETEAQA